MNSKGFVFLAFLLSSLIFSGGLSGPADAQTWASNCWLEVDGPGNEGNEDALRAVGEADCHSIVPECDHPCRVQLGDAGILVCENNDVPGGWIVPIAGDIKLMPGTGSNPAYRRIDVDVKTGKVTGMF